MWNSFVQATQIAYRSSDEATFAQMYPDLAHEKNRLYLMFKYPKMFKQDRFQFRNRFNEHKENATQTEGAETLEDMRTSNTSKFIVNGQAHTYMYVDSLDKVFYLGNDDIRDWVYYSDVIPQDATRFLDEYNELRDRAKDDGHIYGARQIEDIKNPVTDNFSNFSIDGTEHVYSYNENVLPGQGIVLNHDTSKWVFYKDLVQAANA